MPTDWTVEVDGVGKLLRARTRDDESGGELGTFTDATRPTAEEVTEFLEQASTEVLLRLPSELEDAKLVAFAKRMIAVRAAMFVELSLEPDRIDDETSAYAKLERIFDSGMTVLLDAVGDESDAGGTFRAQSVPIISPTLTASPDAQLLEYLDDQIA
jgi:hypothetical protein